MNEGETVVSLEAYRQKKKDEAAQTELLQARDEAIADLDQRLGLMRQIGIGLIDQGRDFAVQITPAGFTDRYSEYVRPRD